MYVCVCHAIRSSDIEALSRNGVDRAEQVYLALEVQTNCEGCSKYVQEALDKFHIGASLDRQ